MALGPEIGDAYLEVHADTRGLPGEIKRAARLAALDFGKEFGRRLEPEIAPSMSLVGRRIQASLRKQGRLSGEGFADSLIDGVEERIARMDQSIADAIIGDDWQDAIDQFDDLDQGLERVRRRMVQLREQNQLTASQYDRATEALQRWEVTTREGIRAERERAEIAEDNARLERIRALIRQGYERDHADAVRENARLDRLAAAARKKYLDDEAVAYRLNAEMDKERQQTLLDREETFRRLREVERITYNLRRIEQDAEIDRAHEIAILDNERIRRYERLPRLIQALDRRMATSTIELERQRGYWRRLVLRMRDYQDQYSVLGRLVRSRSEFLHVVGIVGGTVERAIGRLVDRLFELPEAFQRFADAVQDNGGGVSGFFQTILQQTSGFADSLDEFIIKMAAIGLTAGGAFAALGPVLGMVSSGLSGLLGIVTALAGSLSGALMGALGPLLPILLSAVGGIGALIAAFAGSGEEVEKFTKPFGVFFEQLRAVVQEALFPALERSIEPVIDLLNDFLAPWLANSAEALGEVIEYLVEAFGRPEVQDTLTSLSENLPPILSTLGGALVDLSGGLLGLADALAPFGQEAADWFADLARTFSDWANSAEGKTSVEDFMERAFDSLDSWWGLITSVTDALGALFSAGQGTGDSLVDGLAAGLEKFAQWAQTDEGRAELAEWFDHARNLASGLAEVIGQVADLLGDLDSEASRETLDRLLDTVSEAIDLFTSLAEVGENIFGPAFDGIFNIAKGVLEFADSITELTTTSEGLQSIGDWFAGIGDAISTEVGSWVASLGGVFSGIGEAFEEKVGGFFAGIGEWFSEKVAPVYDAVMAPFNEISSAVQELFSAIGDVIGQAFDPIYDAVSQVVTDVLTLLNNLWLGIVEGAAPIMAALSGAWTEVSTAASSAFETIRALVSEVFAQVSETFTSTLESVSTLWQDKVAGPATSAWDTVTARLAQAWEEFNSWVSDVADWIRGLADDIRGFGDTAEEITTKISEKFLAAWESIRSEAEKVVTKLTEWWDALATGIADKITTAAETVVGWWTSIQTGAETAIGAVTGFFEDVRDAINDVITALGNISWPSPPSWLTDAGNTARGWLSNLPWNASGAIFHGPTVVGVGEAGREAIVPLDRPLWAVDPSVRWLSAVAQGATPQMASGGVVGGGTTIEEGAITVVSPYADPRQVADSLLDELVAASK